PPSSLIIRGDDASAAASTDTFLNSKLTFAIDEHGREICTVRAGAEEIGVMMAWEQGIMEKTTRLLCDDHPNAGSLRVLNVGHGLGINSSSPPALHCIVEPHPDVLQHMKDGGWYSKAGVKIIEEKWQDAVENLMAMGGFDIIYTDTFSENYSDLHQFFELLPDLLSGPESRFSFFNGLGATKVHLAEIGVDVSWHDVDVSDDGGEDRWGRTRQYFSLPVYRLPIGKMGNFTW
ncbi:hypothetical protein MPER_11317, partial [Moniliophthora perniciosa FA553]